MSEVMKNFAMLLFLAYSVNNGASPANAQGIQEENAAISASSPTIIFGEAQQKNGQENAVIVEQPSTAPNPLGNPIPDIMSDAPQPTKQPTEQLKIPPQPVTAHPPTPSKDLGNKFENTLMEANGMVYDVQAYPDTDIKAISNPSNPETIYSPNVNP